MLRTTALFFTYLLSGIPAVAAPPEDLKISRCVSEVRSELKMRGSSDKWTGHAPTISGGKTFRSPTDKFGKWIELTTDANGAPTLTEISKNSNLAITFDGKCKSTIFDLPGIDQRGRTKDSVKNTDWFEDEDLKKLIGDKDPGIIYVWSPGMTYSAKHLADFRAVAKEMKFRFTVVTAPEVSRNEIISSASAFGFPPVFKRLNSVELLMRGATTHFPATFVYQNGRLSDDPVVGVLKRDGIAAEIVKRQADLIR